MPSNPTKHVRKLGSIRYVTGGRESLELDKNGVLLSLSLRVKFTVTNAVSGPSGPLFQALARVIQRLEIMAGGRDVVQSVPGYFLALRALYESEGIPALGMGATVVVAGGAVTTYDISLPVMFTLPLGRREDDTALDTAGLSQLSAIVTWGKTDCSDLFTTPNGATLSNVSCDVEGTYIANPLRDVKTGMAVSSRDGKPFLVRHLDYQEVAVTATNNSQAVILDSRTGLVVTSFLVASLADDVGSDAIINSMRMEAASFVYSLRDAQPIRAENVRNLRLYNSYVTGALYLDPRIDGSVVNAINTSELEGDLKVVLDVTKVGTTCKIGIQREALRPLIR